MADLFVSQAYRHPYILPAHFFLFKLLMLTFVAYDQKTLTNMSLAG